MDALFWSLDFIQESGTDCTVENCLEVQPTAGEGCSDSPSGSTELNINNKINQKAAR